MTARNERHPGKWWGDFEIEETGTRSWSIGPFRMWVLRSPVEWSVSMTRAGEAYDSSLAVALDDEAAPGEGAETRRFGFRGSPGTLQVRPLLAPWPVIVNPLRPFAVPGGQEVVIYVGTPLWISLAVAPPRTALLDAPLHHPSATWFGGDTRQGELCYASRTHANLRLENVRHWPHRAVSPVRIRNRAGGLLEVRNLRLPMPNLSLFADGAGRLWTQTVVLEREEDGDFAALRLETDPPEAAGSMETVGGPRELAGKRVLVRAFGRIFGQG
ncbi:MAG TPA: hypothetical protein VKU85_04485 [bacterium]|nr:hypothetical protein [bacterium]